MLERDSQNLSAGQFSHVEKQVWQPVDRNAFSIPTLQQLVISGAKGALVTLGGLGIITLIGTGSNLWTVAGLSLLTGLGVGLWDFAHNLDARYETFRVQELSRETYQKESAAGAQATQERLSLELIDRKTGYTTYDVVDGVTTEDLATLAQLDALSTRALQTVGFSFDKSKSILGALVAAGLIHYPKPNAAAIWTPDKGAAIVERFREGEEAL